MPSGQTNERAHRHAILSLLASIVSGVAAAAFFGGGIWVSDRRHITSPWIFYGFALMFLAVALLHFYLWVSRPR
jgi:F0F1-type ATP synthase assembly protein I